jgi:hypothetical protein
MRNLTCSLAAILVALSQVTIADARARSGAYGSQLNGTIQSPICSSDNFATGEAVGDLAGSFAVNFDCRDGAIAGGTWLIVVTAETFDGTSEVRGMIRGRVVSGSFEADSDGRRVTVRNVTLSVIEGTGEYADISGGSGSLEAATDLRGTPQFVGTIGLRF